jgi:hypothetical protein
MIPVVKDCYYYLNKNTIKPLCVKCHAKIKRGWYWPGSQEGYGDIDIKCSICGEDIYRKGTDAENKTSL